MVVIYAEKSSLAKEIAHALGAGQRIPLISGSGMSFLSKAELVEALAKAEKK